MDQSIKEIIKSKRLAIVVVSHTAKKFVNGTYTEPKSRVTGFSGSILSLKKSQARNATKI